MKIIKEEFDTYTDFDVNELQDSWNSALAAAKDWSRKKPRTKVYMIQKSPTKVGFVLGNNNRVEALLDGANVIATLLNGKMIKGGPPYPLKTEEKDSYSGVDINKLEQEWDSALKIAKDLSSEKKYKKVYIIRKGSTTFDVVLGEVGRYRSIEDKNDVVAILINGMIVDGGPPYLLK